MNGTRILLCHPVIQLKCIKLGKSSHLLGRDLPEIECLRSTVEPVEEVTSSSLNNVSTYTTSVLSDLGGLHLSNTLTSQHDT